MSWHRTYCYIVSIPRNKFDGLTRLGLSYMPARPGLVRYVTQCHSPKMVKGLFLLVDNTFIFH
jgi:hypothetical protein